MHKYLISRDEIGYDVVLGVRERRSILLKTEQYDSFILVRVVAITCYSPLWRAVDTISPARSMISVD